MFICVYNHCNKYFNLSNNIGIISTVKIIIDEKQGT